MNDEGGAERRLRVHIEGTGRGRRMIARLENGTELATGRTYPHLVENIKQAVRERLGADVKIVLLVGSVRGGTAPPAPPAPPRTSPRLPS